MFDFLQLFTLLSLTSSLPVRLGEKKFEHFILIDFFFPGFYFWVFCYLFPDFTAEFDRCIQLSTFSFFFFCIDSDILHAPLVFITPFSPEFCSVSIVRAAFPSPACSHISEHNAPVWVS